ncbi:protease inhibitor I42 family protein [Saccharibacillus sacchari]|uniref:Protease inhibitor I42 family protein n=1 Tax=Saccharibacillus sacchari TaxID=456493 RepID=A0ACC6PE68_9BACL
MKKTTQMIAAACLTGCLSAGSLLGSGAAFADTRGLTAAVTQTSEAASAKPATQTIQATAGKSFEISLEENPSTGYAWSYKADPALTLISEKSVSLNEEPTIVGAPDQKTWTFQAQKAGTYKIQFDYARPWEKDKAPVQSQTYIVHVQASGKSTVQPLSVLKKKTVNAVKKSEPFRVRLEENGTTGYGWTYKSSSAAVKLIGEKSEPTNTQANIDGAPEQKTWTFRADQPGTYTLTFVYAQPWDTNGSAAQTITYTVNVKG